MKARDGSVLAPKRAVQSETRVCNRGTWYRHVVLVCGHEIEDVPVDAPARAEWRCIQCVREAPPPAPTLTTAEKRRRKAIKLGPDHWVCLVRIARGEYPFTPLPGANPATLIVVQLRDKGYVRFDPDGAAERGSDCAYVMTEFGAAAAVCSSADEWNDSAALAESVREPEVRCG